MRTIAKDYSVGFEGEPTFSFVRRDTHCAETVFTMWEGHFGRIMDQVQPGPEGWTGLALQYHTVTPWWDDPDWKVPDVVAVVEQLDGIDRAQLAAEEREVLDELVTFIREGVERGEALHIQDG